MRTLLNFMCGTIEAFSSFLLRIAMWGVFAMMLIVVVDVILRTFAARSLLIAEEVGGYLLVLMAYLSFAEALKQGRHVKVDLLVGYMSRRLRISVDLILTFLGLAAIVMVAWRSVIMVYRSYERGVRIPGFLTTPVYIPQIVMVVGLFALVLQLLVEIRKKLHSIKDLPGRNMQKSQRRL